MMQHDPGGFDSSGDPRTYFAAERTLLAWIRTGLALMGFGFVVARFGMFLQQLHIAGHASSVQPYGLSLWFGTALIGAGGSAESILRMASLSTNPDYEPGPRDAPSYYDSGCTYIHVSGISRDRNGDLSDFSSRLCAFSFWK